MDIIFDTITGVSLGVEYVEADEDMDNTIIVDLLIIRMLLQWK